jgi:hypothetical protein
MNNPSSAHQPSAIGRKAATPASPLFVSIRVVRGSHHFDANDFVIHDFVYLSPPVTRSLLSEL